ncbi:MAG: chemotaxis protein CheC [Candidatus Brocadiaceae bacterium]|nr:chemotaxis protein CheC [Candidatus Brocadiaceae bacterium]
MNITQDRLKILEIMSSLSIDRASRALSKSLRTGARISLSKVSIADFGETTEKMNEDQREMISVMVNFKGNEGCKLLFMLPLEGSLILTDLFLRQRIGTSKECDVFTESAIQELGNILASHISNALVSDFNAQLIPQPPQVHNDYAGVIFTNLVLEQGMIDDKLLLIETIFEISGTELECYLFLVPEMNSFVKLLDSIGVKT